MLKKLVLRNFQNHKIKEVDFDPHVTVFVGPNDSGKTAIIRALGLLLFNRPLGRSFISHGRKQCILKLFFDKRVLKRVVGKNGYYSLDRKKFKAFGNSVPPEIASALSVQEINVQSQHTPLFWFGLTPGQCAKELNKLVDLESIDRVQSLVAKKLRDKKAELTVAKKRLASARKDMATYRPVKHLHVKLGKLAKLDKCRLESSVIDSLASLCVGCVAAVDTIKHAAKASRAGSAGVASGAVAVLGGQRVKMLADLVGQLEQNQIETFEPIPAIPDYSSDDGHLNRLTDLVLEHDIQLLKVADSNNLLKKAKAKLEKKLNGRCPTCGGILTDRSSV